MTGRRPHRGAAMAVLRGVFLAAVLGVVAAAATTLVPVRLGTVSTASMAPAVPAHSLFLAVPVRADQVRVGDLTMYAPPVGYGYHGTIVRRVVEVRQTGGAYLMRTRRDTSGFPDPWTVDLAGSVVYRVRLSVPLLGYAYPVLSVAGPGGAAAGVAVVMTAVSAIPARRRRRVTEQTTEPEAADGYLAVLANADGDELLRLLMQVNPQLSTAFARAVAHVSSQLRSPLTSIVGYAELLVDDDPRALSGAARARLQVIEQHARELAWLADDLTALADRANRAAGGTPGPQQLTSS